MCIALINYDTGINISYTYDRDKNISGMVNHDPQDNVIGSYSYTYDNNGNQLIKTENGSRTIYTYDELNRLKTAIYPGLGLETYTYDNAGNRLSKVLGADNTTYAYDARNRLTQSINNGITTTYAYDGNGNLTQLTKGTKNTIYTYDGFNRLKETSMSDGQWMAYDYDAFGLRVSTIENGNWYDFTLDRGNVIAEKTGEDDVTRYIRGIDLIAKTDNGEAPAYYLHNAHGDVVNLVNGGGEVLNRYTYDAFGNTASYSETVANRFIYAGEQFDKITGEYYLRARYYDPVIGRFTQEDTYRGDITNPLSLNLYMYCENNPVNFLDPSGHLREPGYVNGIWYFDPDAAEFGSDSSTYQMLVTLGNLWIGTDDTNFRNEYHTRANKIRERARTPGFQYSLVPRATFEADNEQGIYYSPEDPIQKIFGYCDLYDTAFGAVSDMNTIKMEFGDWRI